MNDMEKTIWLAARMIKNQPELFAQAPAECMIILKAAYGEAAFSTPTEDSETPTPELITKIKNIQQTQQTHKTHISPLTDIEKYL